MAKKINEDKWEEFMKDTTDALMSFDGTCVDKMIKAFSKHGFSIDSFENAAGGRTAHVDGDQGIPESFFEED